MKRIQSLLLCLAVVSVHSSLLAQQNAMTATGPIVPSLVSFSGSGVDAQGKPVVGIAGITFSIYRDQHEGAPLWMETQNVQLDAMGMYSVQLGATRPQGLPLEIFASGEARWLGVRIEGAEEQPRVLLLSVPYALKAADAQTVGGLPPSAFVLASPGGSSAASSSGPAQSVVNSSGPLSAPAVGGGGTTNYIPLWTNSADLGNSILYQVGTGSGAKIGINWKTPLFTLDVNGSELMRGLFEMATLKYATASAGYNSNAINLESSAFNSITGKATLNHFQWQAEPVGNNTASPGATLNLLYGTDPNLPAETGLKLNSKGILTFASGQTFPGIGTVSSVGLSAPAGDFTVSGSPVTTSGTLGLGWKVAPTSTNTVNAIVKRDANGAFSAGQISAFTTANTGAVTGTNTGSSALGPGVAGISNEGFGVSGTSTYGYGVYGNGYYGAGIFGATYSGQAVYGTSVTNDSVAIYGNGPTAGQFVGQLLAGDATAGDWLGQLVSQGQATTPYGYSYAGGVLIGAPGYEGVLGMGGNTNGTIAGAGGIFQGGVDENSLALGDGIDAYSGNYAGGAGGYAGFFSGDVFVEGTLYKNGGSFKIDHPLDPANKYLLHSFVESPDMMNVYNGNVVLDGKGEATIQLPDWFETLNRDFRYQLTSIGGFAPLYVAQKVQNNAFKIGGGKAGMEVSWQVTGIRQDPWANAHRIPVEQVKDAREQGFYLNPELYGAPVKKGIDWARHPDAMKQLREHHSKQPSTKPVSLKP
jgi:trimeric autotransporter adhesin